MRVYTREEIAFVEGTELALDWGLKIPEEDIKRYVELTIRNGLNENSMERSSYGNYFDDVRSVLDGIPYDSAHKKYQVRDCV